MTQLFVHYAVFLLKTVTVVAAILLIVAGTLALIAKAKGSGREKSKGKLTITKLNKQYQDIAKKMQEKLLSTSAFKHYQKKQREEEKRRSKKEKAALEKRIKASAAANDETPQALSTKPRLFVLEFNGDIKASALLSLREEITAILLVAKQGDKVLLRLESPGGIVNAYGLAAAQLERLKQANLELIAVIDKIAASGGYMMAVVAHKIIAAPLAVVGSIGVIVQLPNFHRLLKKHHIDFEQLTAGEYKRTLTILGENTPKGRQKLQSEIEEVHELFKNLVSRHRVELDPAKVATGEHWYAEQAVQKQLNLVDELMTSDDVLLSFKDTHDIFSVNYAHKKNWMGRLQESMEAGLQKLLMYRFY